MRTAMICLLSMLTTTSGALAADPETIFAPNVDPVRFGWSGPYLGISAGYGWLHDADRQFTPALEDKGDDWVFGAHAGYLRQFGSFVVGAEAEAMRLDIDFDLASFITVENAVALKARAGYAVDRFLFSGHAGAVYAATNFMGLKDWGWEAGAGVDYALTDNVVIGAQYSHFGFHNFDGTLIDARVDLVTARLSAKF